MNHFLTKPLLLKKLLVFLVTALTAGNLTAAAETTVVEPGKTILIDYQQPVYVYTPEESGLLFVYTDSWNPQLGNYDKTNFLFTDEECTEPAITFSNPLNGDNGLTYTFMVEKGKNYYLYADYIYGMNVILSFGHDIMDPCITLLYPDYKEKDAYQIMLGAEFQIMFNYYDVDCSDIYLIYQTESGEKSLPLEWFMTSDSAIHVRMFEAFSSIRNEILNGSEIKIIIKKPTWNGKALEGDNIVDGNIELTFTYLPLTSVQEETWPELFLSYWPEGSSDAKAVIKFDAPLKQDQDLRIEIYDGNELVGDNNMIPVESSKYEIDGSSLTLYFDDIRRNCEQEVVTVVIRNIVDHNGLLTHYISKSNVVYKEMPYFRLDNINPGYEWTPGEGADISGINDIELWIDNSSFMHFTIDGFLYKADSEELEIPTQECRIIPDEVFPKDYTLIYVPVPEMAKKEGKVVLKPVLTFLDGYEYSLDVQFENTSDSSVGTIAIENNSWNVFNLQGLHILSTDDYNQISALPKGIYIINGKKVIMD